MLESMTHSRQPTRAEATDVANAILDGTDCVMLSGESATGQFPVESVATLARIAAATEPHRTLFDPWGRARTLAPETEWSIPDLYSLSVQAVMGCARAAAVVVPTRSGTTARSIARFRMPVWVGAVSSSLAVRRQLQFSYGIQPIGMADADQDWNLFTRQWVRSENLPGRLAILIQGPSPQAPEANHRMELVELRAG